MKNKYPNGERWSHTSNVCGDSFRTHYRAANVCPPCEAAIEREVRHGSAATMLGSTGLPHPTPSASDVW
jgi:hypothetical protein